MNEAVATATTPLHRLAKIFRSKNAGPFTITVDIFFREAEHYAMVKAENLITRDLVAARYRVPVDDVIGIHYWDAAFAVKVVLRRKVSCGTVNDNDCYGAQQHAPLLDVPVPLRNATHASMV